MLFAVGLSLKIFFLIEGKTLLFDSKFVKIFYYEWKLYFIIYFFTCMNSAGFIVFLI